LQPMSSGC